MPSRSKSRATSQATRRKNAEKEYVRKLKALQSVGAYEPNSTELTPYRRSRINAAWRDLGQYLEPGRREKFFFVPAPPARQKEFLADAKSLSLKTTKRGVILQKEGQRRAKVRYDAERAEFDIELSGKIKYGENKGKRITTKIPIAPYDRVERERARIEAMARSFGPLKKNEAVSFILMENSKEVGASRSTFHSAEALVNYIDKNYHRDNKAAKLAFLRLIVVQKTTLVNWTQDHPPRVRKLSKRNRKIGYRPK